MNDENLDQLVFFVKRPGMYLGNEEIKSIEGFLAGYDMASKNTSFKRKLIKSIFERHRGINSILEIEKGNVHQLFRQIEEISKATGLPEIQVFKTEALKCLIEISDLNGKFSYKEILRTKLIQTLIEDIKTLDSPIESDSTKWSNIIQLSKSIDEWEGENLSADVKELVIILKELQIENNSYRDGNPNSNDNTKEIRLISNQILEIITSDNEL